MQPIARLRVGGAVVWGWGMQTPDDYRKRAAFLRKAAGDALTGALKDSYLELAANWDALAEEAAGKEAEKSRTSATQTGGH
jgi:hypothetical protein